MLAETSAGADGQLAVHSGGLVADLYEFTMAQALRQQQPNSRGIFLFSFRRAPFGGSHILLAGVEPLLESIEQLRFGPQDVDYLRSLGRFEPGAQMARVLGSLQALNSLRV